MTQRVPSLTPTAVSMASNGLRVVDASIMPTSVRCNTNLTCVMLAERIASWMSEGN